MTTRNETSMEVIGPAPCLLVTFRHSSLLTRRRHREARAVGGSERSERTTDVSDERGRQAAGPVPAVPSRRRPVTSPYIRCPEGTDEP